MANLMAMLIQSMSAKLGIATGLNLPEVCRDRFPRPVVIGLWVQAEVIAMATDLAEFLGAALGLKLLFGMPLFLAGVLTGIAAFAILALQARGFRRLEAVIAGLVGVIVDGLRARRSCCAAPAADVARASSPASRARRACCSPSASSARRSCRTSSTCTRR